MKNVRTVTKLRHKVENIIDITLESIVPDLRALIAALFLSTPDECVRIRQYYPKEHLIYLALNTVEQFRKDTALRDMYIKDGFFNEQLEILLDVAKEDGDAGARLMPVFCMALNEADMLKLPKSLEKKIIAHIEWQRQKDGFAIKELSRSKIVVVPADDVLPA